MSEEVVECRRMASIILHHKMFGSNVFKIFIFLNSLEFNCVESRMVANITYIDTHTSLEVKIRKKDLHPP